MLPEVGGMCSNKGRHWLSSEKHMADIHVIDTCQSTAVILAATYTHAAMAAVSQPTPRKCQNRLSDRRSSERHAAAWLEAFGSVSAL